MFNGTEFLEFTENANEGFYKVTNNFGRQDIAFAYLSCDRWTIRFLEKKFPDMIFINEPSIIKNFSFEPIQPKPSDDSVIFVDGHYKSIYGQSTRRLTEEEIANMNRANLRGYRNSIKALYYLARENKDNVYDQLHFLMQIINKYWNKQ